MKETQSLKRPYYDTKLSVKKEGHYNYLLLSYIAAAATIAGGILHLVMIGPSLKPANFPMHLLPYSDSLFIIAGLAQIFWAWPMIKGWGVRWYYFGILGTIALTMLLVLTRIPNQITGTALHDTNPMALLTEISQFVYIGATTIIVVIKKLSLGNYHYGTRFRGARTRSFITKEERIKMLNDLDEKFHNMAMLVMEDPMADGCVIERGEYDTTHKEVAFSFYILWMCAHAYAMRKRMVFDNNEWAWWLQWMKNCFQRGTMCELWKHVEPTGWFNPAFQNFMNKEIVRA